MAGKSQTDGMTKSVLSSSQEGMILEPSDQFLPSHNLLTAGYKQRLPDRKKLRLRRNASESGEKEKRQDTNRGLLRRSKRRRSKNSREIRVNLMAR